MKSENNVYGTNKYHRKNPIKEFDLNQTMYSLVTNESKDDLDLKATGFMGHDMSYRDLIISSDKLAQAFHNAGVKDGDNVAILTISMPIVQQSLLSLSKIGATMSWIDLRSKAKDVINYMNNSNCETIIVFEDMLPLIESIINKTNVKKVIVSSPKDYLSPMIKVLATLKDKKDGKKVVLPDDSRFVRFNDFIKRSLLRIKNNKKVKLEDIEFNKMFKIYSEIEHDAFYILTPHFMEKIKKLYKELDAPIKLTFMENKLHVAVNNGEDSFEYNVLNPINEEEIEQDIIKDIKLITDFVNELNLDNDLFKKEA